jgi:hypothetical protein
MDKQSSAPAATLVAIIGLSYGFFVSTLLVHVI